MQSWKDYFNNRLIKHRDRGYYVIIPKNFVEPIPISCPVCDLLFRSTDDIEYYRTKSCCRMCGLKWADCDLERWNSGWRPSLEDIKNEVKNRQALPTF